MHFEKDLSDADWDDVRRRQVARSDLAREWIALTGMRAGSRVLDIGPGPGEFTCEYAKVVGAAGRVYALEKAESAVAYLRRALEARGLDNVVVLAGDAEEAVDIDGDVDLVVITDVLHHVDRPQAMLHKVAGVMRRHTKVLIAEFDPDAEGLVGPPLEHRLAARQIKKLLDRERLRILDEGRQAYEHYFVIAGRHDSTMQSATTPQARRAGDTALMAANKTSPLADGVVSPASTLGRRQNVEAPWRGRPRRGMEGEP